MTTDPFFEILDKLDKPIAVQLVLKDATMEQQEAILEVIVKACPNLFIVARGLRAALQDDWERSEVAELLMEGVNK